MLALLLRVERGFGIQGLVVGELRHHYHCLNPLGVKLVVVLSMLSRRCQYDRPWQFGCCVSVLSISMRS